MWLVLSTHFLDANIFIELNVDDGDYGEFCDVITKHSCSKTTNNRVLKEVKNVKKTILRAFNRLIRFYRKNKGRNRFFTNKQISQKDLDRIRDIEVWIDEHYGNAKIYRLQWLKNYFIKTVDERLKSLNLPIIESNNNSLFQAISSVMDDDDDAWHVTDAYQWCTSHGKILLWSMDNHIIGPKKVIIQKICSFQGIPQNQCNLDIKHIKVVNRIQL